MSVILNVYLSAANKFVVVVVTLAAVLVPVLVPCLRGEQLSTNDESTSVWKSSGDNTLSDNTSDSSFRSVV